MNLRIHVRLGMVNDIVFVFGLQREIGPEFIRVNVRALFHVLFDIRNDRGEARVLDNGGANLSSAF